MTTSQRFVLKSGARASYPEDNVDDILQALRDAGLEVGAEYLPRHKFPSAINVAGEMPDNAIRAGFYRLMAQYCPDLVYYPDGLMVSNITASIAGIPTNTSKWRRMPTRPPKILTYRLYT